MCYHAEFGRSALRGVGINTGKPRKLESAGTRLSWEGWEALAGPEIHTSPDMCYRVKFDSSATKGVRINGKEPPKLWSAGTSPPCFRGVADLLEIHSFSTCVILPNLVLLGQTVHVLLRRSAWKIWPSCLAFQGHSRSSEPTRIDLPPMTSY